MNEKQRREASKFLSLILRHEPQRIGLQLDEAGWIGVDALLSACATHRVSISRAELDEIVSTNDKRRFAFSDDGKSIRANQGHSVEVSLGYSPQVPPPRLYHGTAARFLDSIRAEGLRKGERHHVHLSADVDTARRVGGRHGKPVVLSVNAEAMHSGGNIFYISENGVWLTDHVPADYIELASAVEAVATKSSNARSPRAKLAEQTVALCKGGSYLNPKGNRIEIAAKIRESVEGTVLYTQESVPLFSQPQVRVATRMSVTNESTVAAIRRMAGEEGGHLACLNFASAKNAGGGFLGGAEAQEESLARSSALYPCLLAAPEYYERNRGCRTTLYLDLAIWSPNVPFIRDENGALAEAPFHASVITAPAPNAGAISRNEPARVAEIGPTLSRRAEFVLRVAAARDVRRLILGAWGCGVFQNDPALVAQTFAELLTGSGRFAGVFQEVVFAIYNRSPKSDMLRIFSDALIGSDWHAPSSPLPVPRQPLT